MSWTAWTRTCSDSDCAAAVRAAVATWPTAKAFAESAQDEDWVKPDALEGSRRLAIRLFRGVNWPALIRVDWAVILDAAVVAKDRHAEEPPNHGQIPHSMIHRSERWSCTAQPARTDDSKRAGGSVMHSRTRSGPTHCSARAWSSPTTLSRTSMAGWPGACASCRRPGPGEVAMGARLFVGNLDFSVDDAGLQQFVQQNGFPVVDARVIRDRDTSRSKGFGFVTLADGVDQETDSDAERGIACGRSLNVDCRENPGQRLRWLGPPADPGRWADRSLVHT